MKAERIYKVILEPHVTEKAAMPTGDENLVVFKVANDAKKREIKIAVEKQTTLKITGSDKQLVGSVASKIKTFRKIEPYKGKGIREKGQYVLKKEGKKK